MRITKYGTLTLSQDAGPLIEGWEIEVEDSDPKDATPGQLLLAYVISWAEERFAVAKSRAVSDVLRKWLQAEVAKKTKAN